MVWKEEEELWKQHWLELIEKWVKYGKFVRDEHKPKTKTNEEFDYLVKKLKHPVREWKPIPRSAGYN